MTQMSEGSLLRALPNIILDKWSVKSRQRVIALLVVAECRVTPTVWTWVYDRRNVDSEV